jgi:hypothetical protein
MAVEASKAMVRHKNTKRGIEKEERNIICTFHQIAARIATILVASIRKRTGAGAVG